MLQRLHAKLFLTLLTCQLNAFSITRSCSAAILGIIVFSGREANLQAETTVYKGLIPPLDSAWAFMVDESRCCILCCPTACIIGNSSAEIAVWFGTSAWRKAYSSCSHSSLLKRQLISSKTKDLYD